MHFSKAMRKIFLGYFLQIGQCSIGSLSVAGLTLLFKWIHERNGKQNRSSTPPSCNLTQNICLCQPVIALDSHSHKLGILYVVVAASLHLSFAPIHYSVKYCIILLLIIYTLSLSLDMKLPRPPCCSMVMVAPLFANPSMTIHLDQFHGEGWIRIFLVYTSDY